MSNAGDNEKPSRESMMDMLEKKLWGREDWTHPGKYAVPGGPGLVNMGNTCYISSVVQILANCPDLLEYFMKGRQKGRYLERAAEGKIMEHLSLTHQLIDLIYVLWFQQRPIKPGGFVAAVRRFAREQGMDEFGGYQQGDASEFMNFMLDMLDTCFKVRVEDDGGGRVRTRRERLQERFYETHQGEVSPIAEMFHVMTCMSIRDMEGRDSSERQQHESAIHLQLPDGVDGKREFELSELMDAHFREERMEGDCKWQSEKLGEKVDAVKQERIVMLPKYLTLVLKRFDWRGFKKNNLVKFPVEDTLDVTPWIQGGAGVRDTSQRLLGTINHVGMGDAGHYWATVRQGGDFIEVNDRMVSRIPPGQVCSQTSQTLIYERL